jgi:hypothetical protein
MRRRTLKRYTELYHQPSSLFPGVETVVFPDGKPEIWFKTADGLGFRVTVSNGPHGLGIEARSFVGTPNLTPEDGQESFSVTATQYRQSAKAQAYKRWYRQQETPEDLALLGPEYRRKQEG